MKSVLRYLFAALLVAVAAVRPADAETAPIRLELVFDAFLGGIRAGTLHLQAQLADDRYDMIADSRSAGLLDYVLGFSSRAETTGVFAANGPRPKWHRASSLWMGEKRSVRNDYRSDGSVRNAAVPDAAADDREPVPAAATLGSIDPLSAVLRIVNGLDGATPCADRIAVFDGRRRYDVVLALVGQEQVNGPFYRGQALHCRLTLHRIVGFSRSSWLPAPTGPQTSDLWFAKVRPDWPPVVVRLLAESTLGIAAMNLVALNRR